MKLAILLTFFIGSFLFILLFFPFRLTAKAYFDLMENCGVYCFRLLGLRLLCGRMHLAPTGIVVENQKGRLQNDDPNNSQFLLAFGAKLYTFLDVVGMDIYFEGGKKDDAATGAIFCGISEMWLSIIFGILKTKNTTANFRKNIAFAPSVDQFNIVFDGVLAVSIFDLLRSYVSARMERAKMKQTN